MSSRPVFARRRKQQQQQGRDFQSSDRFRVAVFGQPGVGKTALSVRFVTRRFIGEYDSSTETIYQRSYTVPPHFPVFFEIMDTPGQEENEVILKEKIKWADAFLLVYAVNDRVSFTEIIRLKFLISHVLSSSSSTSKVRSSPSIAVIGNKCDLEVERMVTEAEAKQTADHLQCSFYETSARHLLDQVATIFENVYKQARKLTPPRAEPGKMATLACCPDASGESLARAVMRTPMIRHQRHKNFKHVDKIPRLQADIGFTQRPFSRNTVLCSHPLSASPPTAAAAAAPKLGLITGSRSELRYCHHREIEQLRNALDSGDDSSNASDALEDDTACDATAVDPKLAAEEFVKKILMLNNSVCQAEKT